MNCLICQAMAGEGTNPRFVVVDSQYWQLEHSYPVALKGWLRFIAKRHVEAIHELTEEELVELGQLQTRVSRLLKELTGCQKEYLMSFSEGEGTQHTHIHMVAKPADLSDDFKGAKIMGKLNVPLDQAIPTEDIQALCDQLRAKLK